MLTIKKFLSVILLVAPISLPAKEFTLPVLTPFDPAAPVRVQGTLAGNDDTPDTHEFSCAAHLTLTNVSGKPILMIATQIQAGIKVGGVVRSQLENREIDDYFLKSELFAPNSTRVLDAKMFPQRNSPRFLKSNSARSVVGDVHIMFVQFADGSTWGDLAKAREFLRQRQQAWEELRLLADLYRSHDEQKFVNALADPAAQGPYLGNLGLIYAQTKSIDPVVQEIENLMRLGKFRFRDMGQTTMESATSPNSELRADPKRP